MYVEARLYFVNRQCGWYHAPTVEWAAAGVSGGNESLPKSSAGSAFVFSTVGTPFMSRGCR